MAKRVPGMPRHWQQYCCCLAMHIGAPFLPLGLEWLLTGTIDHKALLLFVTMYALAIGITSSSILAFSLTLLVGLVYCAAYGAAVKGWPADSLQGSVVVFVLLAVIVVHALERFNRHVVDREPFWEFSKPEHPSSGVATQSVVLGDATEQPAK